MEKHKSSISQAMSYKEIGAFWDTHDLADFWDKTKNPPLLRALLNLRLLITLLTKYFPKRFRKSRKNVESPPIL